MDPNLFHVNWDQLFEALAAVIVLSFLVERSLALVFEHRFYIERYAERGFKAPIAMIFAFAICAYWDFDLPSIVLGSEKTNFVGELLTAAVIAGGSKASIKLFRDILGVQSQAAAAKAQIQQK